MFSLFHMAPSISSSSDLKFALRILGSTLLAVLASFVLGCQKDDAYFNQNHGINPYSNESTDSQDDGSKLVYNTGIMSGQRVTQEAQKEKGIVLIQIKAKSIICSGFLIAKNIVLTAAHCISNEPSESVILFTDNFFGQDIPIRTVTHNLAHPDYGKMKGLDRRDLALIRFAGSLPKGFKPIALGNISALRKALLQQQANLKQESFDAVSDPSNETNASDSLASTSKEVDVSKGIEFVSFGYGTSDRNEERGGTGGILREGSFQSLDFKAEKPYFTVDQKIGSALCHGDSGGPAVINIENRDYVIGVASAVFGKPKTAEFQERNPCRFRSVYMNILFFRPWITQTASLLAGQRLNFD